MMNLKWKNKTHYFLYAGNAEHTFRLFASRCVNWWKGDNKRESAETPQYLYYVPDDQTFSTIHAWGIRINQTPNMTDLYQSGALFTKLNIIKWWTQRAIRGPVVMLYRTRSDDDTAMDKSPSQNGKIFPWAVPPGGSKEPSGLEPGKWYSDKAAFNRPFSGCEDFSEEHHRFQQKGHRCLYLHRYEVTRQKIRGQW